jgi:hypothetical protein
MQLPPLQVEPVGQVQEELPVPVLLAPLGHIVQDPALFQYPWLHTQMPPLDSEPTWQGSQ